jgi:hypothetical protein
MRLHRFSALLALSALACVGTTGGDLLEVQAYAAGPVDAGPNLSFETGAGYRVSLSEARIFVGGVYLNRSRPTSVASDTSCSLPGIYVAQVLGGREVDLLSAEPQAFPGTGFATSEPSSTGEVWLADGDVNGAASSTVVLRVSGSAERHGVSYPFQGKLTIGQNRALTPSDDALPGQNPICKQRIVSPIAVDLLAKPGQALLLRVDPRAMFGNVDFATLSRVGEVYQFADQTGVDQASDNLYAGLRRSSGVYEFSWVMEQK